MSTWVKLENLSESSRTKLIADLTLAPHVDRRFCFADPEPFVMYKLTESNSELFVPKFSRNIIAAPTIQNSDNVMKPGTCFVGTLRPTQLEPFHLAINAIKTRGGGIMSLPCGFGKTPLALAIALELQVKTIIVVHRDILLNQWIKAISDFTTIPVDDIGKIGNGDVYIPESCQIIIAMVQTLIRQPPTIIEQLSQFQLSIFDEVDVFGSFEFSKIFRCMLNPTFTLGMSATPTRRDGCHKMFQMFLGPVIFSGKKMGGGVEQAKYKNTKLVHVPYISPLPWSDQFNYKGGPLVNKMYIELMADSARMIKIITTIRNVMTETPSRHMLVLTARREQVSQIAAYLEHPTVLPDNIRNGGIGQYMGGTSATRRIEIFKCRIIVATYQSASVGMNIPTLDTLFITLPVREVEQACGRIGRGDVVNPLLILDLVDVKSPYFTKWSEYRKSIYKKLGIPI